VDVSQETPTLVWTILVTSLTTPKFSFQYLIPDKGSIQFIQFLVSSDFLDSLGNYWSIHLWDFFLSHVYNTTLSFPVMGCVSHTCITTGFIIYYTNESLMLFMNLKSHKSDAARSSGACCRSQVRVTAMLLGINHTTKMGKYPLTYVHLVLHENQLISEEYNYLGCEAVLFGDSPTFRRNCISLQGQRVS
jgi:hypothetical protein